jgi:peroxiredoxin
MTDAPPPDPAPSPAHGVNAAPGGDAAPGAEGAPEVRRPRKRFILIGLGIGLLIIVLIGLLTSIGSSHNSGQPEVGDQVPHFTATNIGPTGPSQVSVPTGGGGSGNPAVLLFFGAWCTSCRQELPPLTAVVRQQERSGGPLSQIRVIGVDSFDKTSIGKSFIHDEGVTFPVASDPQAGITSGSFFFDGDPYTVFVRGDGTISKIVAGAQLTPATFTHDERALLPTAS